MIKAVVAEHYPESYNTAIRCALVRPLSKRWQSPYYNHVKPTRYGKFVFLYAYVDSIIYAAVVPEGEAK